MRGEKEKLFNKERGNEAFHIKLLERFGKGRQYSSKKICLENLTSKIFKSNKKIH